MMIPLLRKSWWWYQSNAKTHDDDRLTMGYNVYHPSKETLLDRYTMYIVLAMGLCLNPNICRCLINQHVLELCHNFLCFKSSELKNTSHHDCIWPKQYYKYRFVILLQLKLKQQVELKQPFIYTSGCLILLTTICGS
jgi:hypothetical protein